MNGKLVLVVDDSPLLQRLISMILRKEGYRVEIARDGQEALEKIRQLEPDVVLLDVIMPNKDGYQVVREMREQLHLRRQPRVILLTGVDNAQNTQQAHIPGVDDVLTKPFSPDELTTRVRAVS